MPFCHADHVRRESGGVWGGGRATRILVNLVRGVVGGCLPLWKHSSDCSARLSRLPWLSRKRRERQTPFILIKANFTLLFHLPVLLHELTIKLYGAPRAA